MRLTSFLLLYIFVLPLCYANDNDGNFLTVTVMDSKKVTWSIFLNVIVKSKKPVLLQKAFRDQSAYKFWSLSEIYYNPGSAFTFMSNFDDYWMSIRKHIRYRPSLLRLESSMPRYLRADVHLPNCLNCDLLVKTMKRPLWFLNFHAWQSKLKLPHTAHELRCLARKSENITLIPDWTISMIDRYPSEVLDDSDYYQIELKEGDCLYIPPNYLRQTDHKEDSIGVAFRIERDSLDKVANDYLNCQPLDDQINLNKIKFIDEESEDGNYVGDSWVVGKLIRLLENDDKCFSKEEFLNLLYKPTDSNLFKMITSERASQMFNLLDLNDDGQFCYSDIDSLTFNTAGPIAIALEKIIYEIAEYDVILNDNVKSENHKHDEM